MLEDIKKILEISKRGIVVVENGKPSYVIVPFDDYSGKKNAIINKRSDYFLGGKSEAESIEEMIEKELQDSRERILSENEEELKDIFDKEREIDAIKKDLKEVRLEDLPF